MSTGKKRKISALSGLELDIALARLKKLRRSVFVEEVPASEPGPTFADQLEIMIKTLESRQNDPLSLSFSAADGVALDRSKIVLKGLLDLKTDLSVSIAKSRDLGSDKLWSHDHFRKHLTFLATSFTNTNETSSRTVIDTFFFRSTAMIPSPEKMVVMLETPVPPVRPRSQRMDLVSRVIDYTAVVAEPDLAKIYITTPPMMNRDSGTEMTAFFVAEAKADASTGTLAGHLPQVLLELVACAKHLGKTHIRGALTTGTKWIFVAVEIDTDNDGAKYWRSPEILWSWSNPGRDTVDEGSLTDPALIAGILSSWIPASFQEVKGDQWFDLIPRTRPQEPSSQHPQEPSSHSSNASKIL